MLNLLHLLLSSDTVLAAGMLNEPKFVRRKLLNECLFQFDPTHIRPELELSSYLFQTWISFSPRLPTDYSASALIVT